MGFPWPPRGAAGRVGVPGDPTGGQGQAEASSPPAPGTTSDCTPAHGDIPLCHHPHQPGSPFLALASLQGPYGSMPMVGHPCLCFVPMERRGAQLGGLAGQALCSPSLIQSHQTKGACPKEKKGSPSAQLGTSSRWLRNANSLYPRFCLSHFCFY